MLNDDFLDKLPDDPNLAGHAICKEFSSFHNSVPENKGIENYGVYLSFIGLFQAFCEAHNMQYDFPDLTSNRETNITRTANFFTTIEKKLEHKTSEITIGQAKEKYSSLFSRGYIYAFSDGDLKQIQDRINELRKYLEKSKQFDDDHRRRLLKKLERLQAELHKKMSNLDVFWGLFGEAGVALGKFGKDAKPFTDRIQDIVKIGWRAQARAEELPSDAPPPLLNEAPENQIEEGQSE